MSFKMTHAIAVFALIAALAVADLKNLTPKEKFDHAKHIFSGKVLSVETKDMNRAPKFPDWVTRHYKFTVEVSAVRRTTKSIHENPSHPADETVAEPGGQVHVMMWQAVTRPDYFKGDFGARMIPEVGKSYTFFAHFLHHDPHLRHMYHDSFPHVDEEGMKAYNVLMPNGVGPEAEIRDDRFTS
jgi:hypothetical protein